KSVQIDSPYQQMILEGVLTESVRDEKLFVSFTVEGYFHYVLGEVMCILCQRVGFESMIEYTKHKKFSHLDEGLTQFFVNEVNRGNHDLIIRAQKNDFEKPNLLASSVVQMLMLQPNFKDIYEYDDEILWKSVINKLFAIAKYSKIENCLNQIGRQLAKKILNNDILSCLTNEYLKSIIKDLENTEIKLAVEFYLGRYHDVISYYENQNEDDQFNGSSLNIIASSMIDIGMFNSALDILQQEKNSATDIIDNLRLESIACNGLELNDRALKAIGIAIIKSRELYGSFHLKTAELLNLEGLYRLVSGDFQMAMDSFDKSGDIYKRLKGVKNFEFATTLNNKGLVSYHSGNIQKALMDWEEAVTILASFGMGAHPETANTHKNLAFAHEKLGQISNAKDHVSSALEILRENGLLETEIATECAELLSRLDNNVV
ncbi:MAG: tetratricopeptide repeat protein, partial [Bacteroidota bacterium]